jgi:hypothetical protein
MHATDNLNVIFPASQIGLWILNYLHLLFYRVLTMVCAIWAQTLLEFLHRSNFSTHDGKSPNKSTEKFKYILCP